MVGNKIGLLLDTLPRDGGTFQYSISMLNAFEDLSINGLDVIVLSTNSEWSKLLSKKSTKNYSIKKNIYYRLISKLFDKINLPIEYERNILSLFHPLARKIKKLDCKLWVFPAADSWSYKLKVNSIVTIYDLMHRYEKRFPEVSDNGIYEWREKHYTLISKYALAILVDSEIGKQHVIDSYNLNGKKIHPLPYIAPIYNFNSADLLNFEKKYTSLNNFIFYPAQYWLHKNHINLLYAIFKLKSTYRNISVVFVGSKSYNGFKKVEKLIKDLNLIDNIVLLDYVPQVEIPIFYKKARCLIMPTYFGPTNIPPLEAIAIGCPVGISNIYAIREQLGECALYFNPNSVDEIANTIEKLWTDDKLCTNLIELGKDRNQLYSQEIFNNKVTSIIKTIITCYNI
jgi:glycosyltransferase involved in cell wall biosynthesis